MHSVPARLNSIVSMALTALGLCAALMAAVTFVNETYLAPSRPTGTLIARPTPVQKMDLAHPLKRSAVRPIERSIVFLDVEADFTPAFNWNTKQVYVYAVAHYATANMPRNEVTLWDTIITSAAEAKLSLPRVADYYFDDYAQTLKGSNVTVRLWYHIMSHSGFTFTREVVEAATSFIAN
jgi:signal peptidase complex subunit 3